MSIAVDIVKDIAGAVRLGVLFARKKKFEKRLEKNPEKALYYKAQLKRITKTLEELGK